MKPRLLCRALYKYINQSERTDGVAAIDLIDGQLGLREPGVASAVPQFDEQPFISGTAEVAFAEVTAIRSGGQLLVLTNKTLST